MTLSSAHIELFIWGQKYRGKCLGEMSGYRLNGIAEQWCAKQGPYTVHI